MTEKLKIVNETQLELERHFDDDCEVVNHYYIAKKLHPDIPFYLYSNEGDEKEVACESMEQFMSVLEYVRDTCPEERLSYSNPL